MRYLKPFSPLFGLLSLALLAGCGGDDDHPNNSFQGSYAGSASTAGFLPYNFASNATNIAISVSRSGTISGTVTDTASGTPFTEPGEVSGRISSAGQITNGTIDFPAHGAITFSGTVAKDSDGGLAATLNAVFTPRAAGSAPQNGTITIDVSRG